MRGLNDVFYPRAWLEASFAPSLLNLTAARYLVVQAEIDNAAQLFHPPLPIVARAGGITVYENPDALPRAFFVPRVEVVDPPALLERLANPELNVRKVALVESSPPTGFTGEADAAGTATVEFVRSDPERVELRVDAPQRGFVILADQYAAGWRAEVNSEPTPILRANYAFRAVEVPAGTSIVSFRYFPWSVVAGAFVSAVTVLALVAWGLWRLRRRR
jgi:hypothetical protein